MHPRILACPPPRGPRGIPHRYRARRALPPIGKIPMRTPIRHRRPLFFALLALVPLPAAAQAAADAVPAPRAAEQIAINDNRRPAGTLRDGVLTLRLEARMGEWRAEGEDDVARPVAAWAEEGEQAQNPGPLIRVPQGTEVR